MEIDQIDLRVINLEKMFPDVELPQYKHHGDSGMDVKAYFTDDFYKESSSYKTSVYGESIRIMPHGIVAIPTGIKVEIPYGYEIQIRPRSGLAVKCGLTVLNTPGTIDSGYRGEIKVILHNVTNDPVIVAHGDRIAQMVLCPVSYVQWKNVEKVDETARGEGGFGSTGKK
jgi:dUTP pyrophosphatase